MPLAFKLSSFFASSAFLFSSCAYVVLHSIMPHGYVFAGLPRMFMYHESHPFQYIAIVALTYAVIATVCVIRWPRLTGWRQRITIVGIMLLTIIAASVPGGILWKIHDMQAGFFTTGTQFWSDLFWGASQGLQAGWFVIALSFPYNFVGLIVGYAVSRFGFSLGAKSRPENSSAS